MVTKNIVEKTLREVLDPELGINIVDLGLIYDVTVRKNKVHILMTLTFPGCPLGTTINKEVKDKLYDLVKEEDLTIEITFNPPWDFNKVSPEVRLELGIGNV